MDQPVRRHRVVDNTVVQNSEYPVGILVERKYGHIQVVLYMYVIINS